MSWGDCASLELAAATTLSQGAPSGGGRLAREVASTGGEHAVEPRRKLAHRFACDGVTELFAGAGHRGVRSENSRTVRVEDIGIPFQVAPR